MRRRWFPLVLLAAACAAGCTDAVRESEAFLDDYFAAVQAQDDARLICMLAGADGGPAADAEAVPDGDAGTVDPGAMEGGAAASREDFRRWVLSRYDAYLDGRDRGRVPFGPDGLVLVKTFALGKGTWCRVEEVRDGDGVRFVRTGVRFGYDAAAWHRFTPGTTVYLAAAPPGAIEGIVVPRGSERIEADVLEEATVEWTLVRAPATTECEERWTLADVRVPEEGLRTRSLVWSF